ncbi:MAG: TRAP transporter large permease [Roseobacter sp.]|jgi:tripartite ATP-independent transporter DctM subunit|uniref:TRAP transporter large permease protein n=2 Tax=Sulfitobacter TaxID=60136 RepID=A0A1H3BFF3_9RHOB|nr:MULTISPECIES: TRAP transporter large permease [Sulfitobacter]MAN09961.1 TRAP transporter large permease [Roseobacter sp.]AXI52757.1 TRAP transporter large permease [Sulfitobacter sp. SK025]EAP79679.1 DedA family protein [Sulfitobacter sp. NAS-14.1]EAP82872.1 DedA family protein [Sulfitobacter sp. EE-36]KAJ29591.1 C4-dicarboxylate ABC transporter permease [Sulfitobacter pontiacus 3SOLIMAR09]|tara:strand:+ start:32 stop:1312 length:1281 start_codon:yes stop_codon:yes gene_type:complete
MGLTILLGIFGVSVVIGIPVAFAMGIAALTAFWYEGFPLLITFQRSVSGISVFSLLAIPFFVFAGELMLHGGIAMRLVKFASALVGHVRGGLASVNIFSSMLFGGISGSAVADISALGSILIPVMKERGYHSDYAVNVTVTSSIAGIVIPPSHNMIIFAVAAGGGISISKLFLAGVVPGMLMCLCLAVAAYVIAIKRNYPAEPFPGWRAVGVASLHALPGLVTAVIIVGGVLSGIFTVTESGAFGAIYALLLTYFVYRSLDWNGFKTAVVSAVRTTAMVMVLIGFASSFAYLLALYQVPEKLSSFMLGISEEKIAVLLMINIMLLVLGMIMDMAALILICTPIFLPIVRDLGMDPTQFGIMLLVNLGLGLCTPPVGTCLFVGCAVGRVKIEETLRTIWPFYLAILMALLLVTYVPAVSLFLPSLLE